MVLDSNNGKNSSIEDNDGYLHDGADTFTTAVNFFGHTSMTRRIWGE
jgi:hypothetical protein